MPNLRLAGLSGGGGLALGVDGPGSCSPGLGTLGPERAGGSPPMPKSGSLCSPGAGGLFTYLPPG